MRVNIPILYDLFAAKAGIKSLTELCPEIFTQEIGFFIL